MSDSSTPTATEENANTDTPAKLKLMNPIFQRFKMYRHFKLHFDSVTNRKKLDEVPLDDKCSYLIELLNKNDGDISKHYTGANVDNDVQVLLENASDEMIKTIKSVKVIYKYVPDKVEYSLELLKTPDIVNELNINKMIEYIKEKLSPASNENNENGRQELEDVIRNIDADELIKLDVDILKAIPKEIIEDVKPEYFKLVESNYFSHFIKDNYGAIGYLIMTTILINVIVYYVFTKIMQNKNLKKVSSGYIYLYFAAQALASGALIYLAHSSTTLFGYRLRILSFSTLFSLFCIFQVALLLITVTAHFSEFVDESIGESVFGFKSSMTPSTTRTEITTAVLKQYMMFSIYFNVALCAVYLMLPLLIMVHKRIAKKPLIDDFDG